MHSTNRAKLLILFGPCSQTTAAGFYECFILLATIILYCSKRSDRPMSWSCDMTSDSTSSSMTVSTSSAVSTSASNYSIQGLDIHRPPSSQSMSSSMSNYTPTPSTFSSATTLASSDNVLMDVEEDDDLGVSFYVFDTLDIICLKVNFAYFISHKSSRPNSQNHI